MKYKNISKGVINLESGPVNPGSSGECTTLEAKFLLAQGRIEEYVAPKPKKKAAKKDD